MVTLGVAVATGLALILLQLVLRRLEDSSSYPTPSLQGTAEVATGVRDAERKKRLSALPVLVAFPLLLATAIAGAVWSVNRLSEERERSRALTRGGPSDLGHLALAHAGATEGIGSLARGEHDLAQVQFKLFLLELGRDAYEKALGQEDQLDIEELINDVWVEGNLYYGETVVTIKGPPGDYMLQFPMVVGIRSDGCSNAPVRVRVSGRSASGVNLWPLTPSTKVFCVLDIPISIPRAGTAVNVAWTVEGRSDEGAFSVAGFDFGRYRDRIRRFVKRVHLGSLPRRIRQWKWERQGSVAVLVPLKDSEAPYYQLEENGTVGPWKRSSLEVLERRQYVYAIRTLEPLGPAAPVFSFTSGGYEFLHDPDRKGALQRIAARIRDAAKNAGRDGTVAIAAVCQRCDEHAPVVQALLDAAPETRVQGAWVVSPDVDPKRDLVAFLLSARNFGIECRVATRGEGLVPGFAMHASASAPYWSSGEPDRVFDAVSFAKTWASATPCGKVWH